MGEVRVEQRGGVVLATLVNPPHGLMDAATLERTLEAGRSRRENTQ
jgi:hypothetical protein